MSVSWYGQAEFRDTVRPMLEFATASAPSKDPSALAAILTQKSADGWNVVGITSTTSEVTAFLSRVAISAPAASASPAYAPASASTPAAEPAGWAVAPEPSPAPAAMAPISTPAYQPAASAAPAVPAGWYADPAGRFDLRYWDGGAWTEHVSRAGQQYTDPPNA
jgi:hypothetical protein